MEKQLKDYLHLYLGCDIKVWSDNYKGEVFKLTPTFLDLFNVPHYTIKPILRPLSSMTEEEALEYAKHYGVKGTAPAKASIQNGEVKITIGDEETHCAVLWPRGPHGQKPESLRYLLSKHFDLFDLVPAGLAIEASTINQ